MATITENYNLVKPDGTDNIDISVLNDNFDIIDAQMKENEDAALLSKIATNSHVGAVMPDGETLIVDTDGTIHSRAIRSSVSLTTNWTQNGNVYTQVVSLGTIPIDNNSKVDLQITESALSTLIASGVVAIWIKNDNGVLTAYAFGGVPSSAIDVPCTISSTISELISIAITSNPTKTTYSVNENLDLTGIAVTATYADGSVSDVTDLCVSNPSDGTMLTIAGTFDVIVSYAQNGITKTSSFEIVVE